MPDKTQDGAATAAHPTTAAARPARTAPAATVSAEGVNVNRGRLGKEEV
jgi:hypothetical protein